MYNFVSRFLNKKVNKSIGGQTLIELLVTIGISAILFPALLGGFLATRNGRAQSEQRLQALGYYKEAQEALRVVVANGWGNISNGTYHPVESANTWSFASGSETIASGNFTRQIVISDVYRDGNGDIAASGTLDPSTKRATISVSWTTPSASSVSLDSYFSRNTNQNRIDTRVSDFTSGTIQGATVSATTGTFAGDGQVQLGAGGGGNWCAPNLSIAALDLPKSGVANAVYAIEGKAFTGTGENASGVSYASVNIGSQDPPVATIGGTFDGFKTNDGIFGEAGYAYLATDNNGKEIVIVDLGTIVGGKYAEAGYFDAPGNGNGNGVVVSGNVGYMVDGSGNFRTFNVTSKTGSRPQLASLALAGTGTRVILVGNYAYVSISGNTSTELQIIDVSNPSSPTVVGQANVDGASGKSMFVNTSGTRAFLATGVSATQRELFIIDISTKTGNRPVIGSYEANGMNPRGVTVVPGNIAILVGTSGEEYQVIDIQTEANPTRCGGLNIDSGVNGVSSVLENDGDAFSYIITGDSTSEFKIIEGGPGGNFSTEGTYTSPAFDAGQSVAFNRFTVNHNVPPATTIQYEVAVADAVSNSCAAATYAFSGPYATSSALPASTANPSYVNPGRCLRYRVTLTTTDITQSPTLYDVTFNYSP